MKVNQKIQCFPSTSLKNDTVLCLYHKVERLGHLVHISGLFVGFIFMVYLVIQNIRMLVLRPDSTQTDQADFPLLLENNGALGR